MIVFGVTDDVGSIEVPKNTPLPEMNQCLDYLISWSVCHGVYRFEAEISYKHNFKLTLTAKTPIKKLVFSQYTNLSQLHKAGYFPSNLQSHELLIGENTQDGQNKIRSDPDNRYTVLETRDYEPKNSICMLSYAVSDTFVGCFCLGATKVKYAGSMKIAHIGFNVGMTPAELDRYARSPNNYNPDWTVERLMR